jgi:hypothetical protein
VLFLVCQFRRAALEKPKAELTRLFCLGDLFQWKATKSPNKQALNGVDPWMRFWSCGAKGEEAACTQGEIVEHEGESEAELRKMDAIRGKRSTFLAPT